MTPDDLEKLLAAATPGPWEEHDHGGTVCRISDIENHLCTPIFDLEGRQNDYNDAKFAAAAMNAAPALLRLWRAAKSLRSIDETTSPSIRSAKDRYLDDALRELEGVK